MAGNSAAHPPGDTKLEGGGRAAGREHDPGEGRASFGAGGPGARSLGRGFLALSPCSLLTLVLSPLLLPLSSPSPAPVFADCGQT